MSPVPLPGAEPDGALARLAARLDEHIRPGPYELTIDDVAAGVGMDVAIARRLWRAMGFAGPEPGARIATTLDVEAFRRATEQIVSADGVERLVRQTRVVSAAVARIAEVWVDDVRDMLDAGLPPDAVADAMIAELDLDRLTWLLGYVHRHQLQAAMRRELASRAHGRAGTVRVVGFADLVGFTASTRDHSAAELAAFVESFEQLVYDTIAEHGGRLVKTIGDEAMYTADDAVAAVAIAIALSRRGGHAELPPLRVGLDRGPAFWFEGDLYGPAVNVASRVVRVAEAGAVIATAAVRDAHPAGSTWSALGGRELKGIGCVDLWRAARDG